MSFTKVFRQLFGTQRKIYSYESASLYHAEVHALANLLVNAQWSEFEREFGRHPPGDRHLLLTGFGNLYLDNSALQSWLEDGSHVAHLLCGAIKMTEAWLARGASRGHDVGDDSFQQFYALLEEAEHHLRNARQMCPQDGEAAARLIRVAMGLQTDADRYRALFAQSSADDRHHLGAGFYMVDALSAKWAGSHEEMLAFARAQAERSPLFLSLVPLAHIERWFYLDVFDNDVSAADGYFQNPVLREEILDCYRKQCDNKISDYFDMLSRSVWALALMKIDQHDAARCELTYLGPRVSNKPWDYVDSNTLAGVNRVRQSLGLSAVDLNN